jgi:hypothetical protein
MWWLITLSLFVVSALNWALVFRWKHSFKDAVQLTATLVSIASTVTLGFFAWQNLQQAKHSEELLQRREWTELRNTIWDIMDQYPPSGVESLRLLPIEERIRWGIQIRRLLNAQGTNQVLLENEECLAHWRNAIAAERTLGDFLPMSFGLGNDSMFVKMATSMLVDVGFVWDKLVLQSKEVSPTGGLPSK